MIIDKDKIIYKEQVIDDKPCRIALYLFKDKKKEMEVYIAEEITEYSNSKEDFIAYAHKQFDKKLNG